MGFLGGDWGAGIEIEGMVGARERRDDWRERASGQENQDRGLRRVNEKPWIGHGQRSEGAVVVGRTRF